MGGEENVFVSIKTIRTYKHRIQAHACNDAYKPISRQLENAPTRYNTYIIQTNTNNYAFTHIRAYIHALSLIHI